MPLTKEQAKEKQNQAIIQQGEKPGWIDKLVQKSNEHYQHPIKGALARWQNSMQNKTNPLVGLSKTAVPAANGALIAVGLGSIPGLIKTIASKPIRTLWNFIPEVGIGYVGAKVGDIIDRHILRGDGSLGTTIGGLAGIKTIQNAFNRARRSFYRNITPFGYGNIPSNRSRKKEIVDWIKEIINTKPLPTEGQNSQAEVLHWLDDLDYIRGPHNATKEALVRFRDQALRKALYLDDLPYEPQIYRLNDDGTTYSYDVENINKIREQTGSDLIPDNFTEMDLYAGQEAYGDMFTNNGGYVGIVKEPDGTFMIDTWDVQPFKENYRTLSKFMSKIPGLKNFEAIDFVRGNPFTVKHKLKDIEFKEITE